MFNVGGGEILVIALIALIVLGPQRLPDAARQVGKAMGDLRRLSNGFQNELKGALDEADRTERGPARDVLGESSTASPDRDAAAKAVESVSRRRPPRTTPLRAEPLPKARRARPKGP